jgi:hypothetical protein
MGSVILRVGILACVLSSIAAATVQSARSRSVAPEQPGTLSLRVIDRAERPVIARVRIEPLTWRERMRLELHGGASARVLTAQGETELQLVPGEYRVLASHGPEWSLAHSELHISAGARLEHTIVLERQVALEGWRAADLHLHTARSQDAAAHGGVSSLALRAEGIELAVATDHNRSGDLGPGIDSLPGAEVTTWGPEIGHFNAFPLQRVPKWRGTTPSALIAELKRDPDVFVQVNHPRLEHHIGYFALGGFDGSSFAQPGFHLNVDGLEVWNGYDLARSDAVLKLLAEWRGWVARGRKLTATGGSDSHGAPGHFAGYPRTYVRAESAAELAPALKASQAFVSNGPLLALRVNGKGPGETLHMRGDRKLTVELRVLAADWLRVEQVELWAGERRVWQAHIPAASPGSPLRYRAEVHLRVDGARCLQAVVHGGSGFAELLGRTDVEPLAFTNPVFLAPQPTAAGPRR